MYRADVNTGANIVLMSGNLGKPMDIHAYISVPKQRKCVYILHSSSISQTFTKKSYRDLCLNFLKEISQTSWSGKGSLCSTIGCLSAIVVFQFV